MQKKILSMILAIAMVVSMFAGISITASAAETVTLTFSGGSGTSQDTWTFADDASGISAVVAKGTHTTSPRLDSNLIRIYGTADKNNTLTVSGPVGCNITGIAFAMGTSYNDLSKVTADSGAIDTGAATWTGSANSVTFTTTAQWRLNSITVTYEASTCDHAEYTTDTTAATCTEAGKNVYTCSACGITWEETIDALGHSVAEWTETLAPACTTAGSKEGTCATCNETVTESIPSLGHSYGEAVVTAPTCTEKGYSTLNCTACDYSKTTDEVAALGHTYVDGACSVCGEAQPESKTYAAVTVDTVVAGNYIVGSTRNTTSAYPTIYPATNFISSGHWCVSDSSVTAVEDAIDNANLPVDAVIFTLEGDNTNGFKISYTAEDGTVMYLGYSSYEKAKIAFAVGYDTFLWKVIADPDGGVALQTGTEGSYYTLSNNTTATTAIRGYANGTIYNGLYLFKEVTDSEGGEGGSEACEHANTEEVAAVAATCTTAGATAGVKCTDCGVIISGCEEIAALGHSYTEVTVDATCDEAGSITSTCSVCSDVQVTEIPATGNHNIVDGECTECGAIAEKYILTNKLADGDKVIIYNPSAGKAMDKACTNDTTRYKVGTDVTVVDGVIENLNGAIVWTVAAVEGGYSLTNEDGQVLSIEGTYNSIPYDKENITWTLAAAATDTCVYVNNTNGKQLYYGTSYNNFSAHNPLNYTEAEHAMQVYVLNGAGLSCTHAWDDGVVTEATCTETGKTVYTCTLCGESKEEVIDAKGHEYVLSYINADSMAHYLCSVCDYVSDPCYIYNKVDTIANGDTVVIGCSSGGLSATASGSKLARAYGEYSFYNYFNASMLAVETPAQALTVGYDEATGYYTFSYNDGTQDLYLTTGATGSSLSFAALDEATNLQKWVLEAGDGYYYIKNVEAAYQGNAQYIEYYYDFTTYKLGNGGYAYEMNFFAAAPSDAPACETNHANTSVIEAVAATCTEYGFTGNTRCEDCSLIVAYGTSIEPIGHSYGEGVADPAATCVASGVMTYTCSACGDVKTEEIPATGEHTYVDGTCTGCGATESVTPPVTGDVSYVKVTTAPEAWDGTYIVVYEDGEGNAYIFNGKDAVNGYVAATYANGVIASSAEIEAVEVIIATMEGGYSVKTADGYINGTSGSNKLNFSADAQANNISMTEAGNVLIESNTSVLTFNSTSGQMRFRYYKAASYAGMGQICLYAKVAGATEECAHANTELQNAVAATCTEPGYTGDTYCLDCSTVIEQGSVIEATGHSMSYTNNGDGTHNAACSACSDATETNVAHTYVDGACACGALEPKPNANLTVTMSISVGAEMQVFYTILNSRVKTYDSFYLEVVKESATGETTTTIFSLANNNLTAATNAAGSITRYSGTYTGIFAMEMGDNFTATLYAVAADGTVSYGPAVTSSIKTFLYEQLALDTSSAELKTLAVDMLNYGAAAQLQFEYDTENLVNADLTDAQKALGTQGIPEATDGYTATGSGAGVIASVSVQSKVMLYLTFRYRSNADSNLKVVIKDAKGNILSEYAPYQINTANCKAIYDNVGARQMRELITIELYDNDVLVSQSITWSVETYVAQTRANTSSTDALINVVNAMLNYGDSAYAFLEASGQ